MEKRAARKQLDPSDSRLHNLAEERMITQLAGRKHDWLGNWPDLRSGRKIDLPGGVHVEPDGVADGDRPILVEVSPHVGNLRVGQPDKLLADVLKLLFARRSPAYRKATLVPAVTGDDVKNDIKRGWRGKALDAFGIEVVVVPPSLRGRHRLQRHRLQSRQRQEDLRGRTGSRRSE